MLSDEEKKAIETIKFLKDLKWYEHAFDNGTEVLDEEEKQDIKIVLNLIEKQSKEIEKLKEKCKELIFEKQELSSALLDSIPNDKIKAKIEEVDKDENASIPDFIEYAKEYATQKLQSLLEKE